MDYTPLIEKRRQRLEELETVIAEPDFFSDQKKASEIMREHRRLKELLETWDELNGTEQQLADNQELAKTDDPELELKCKVYNINYGKNRAIMEKCSSLWLY